MKGTINVVADGCQISCKVQMQNVSSVDKFMLLNAVKRSLGFTESEMAEYFALELSGVLEKHSSTVDMMELSRQLARETMESESESEGEEESDCDGDDLQ